jgi:hypothetical protein
MKSGGTRVEWTLNGPASGGQYAKSPNGVWYVCTPNGIRVRLHNHDVTEHEDGTITVYPSIVATRFETAERALRWHGYLERGQWRDEA